MRSNQAQVATDALEDAQHVVEVVAHLSPPQEALAVRKSLMPQPHAFTQKPKKKRAKPQSPKVRSPAVAKVRTR